VSALGGCVFCVYEGRLRDAPAATREVPTPNGERALCERHAAAAVASPGEAGSPAESRTIARPAHTLGIAADRHRARLEKIVGPLRDDDDAECVDALEGSIFDALLDG
jgi:hypothetical protein